MQLHAVMASNDFQSEDIQMCVIAFCYFTLTERKVINNQ